MTPECQEELSRYYSEVQYSDYMMYNPFTHLGQPYQLTVEQWNRIKATLSDSDLAGLENGAKVEVGRAARNWKKNVR